MDMLLSESQDQLVDVKGLEPSASHWASISATLRPGDTVCDLLRAPMPERSVWPAHRRLKSLIAEL